MPSTLRDARGAVFVEKLIVMLPLLAAFFASWELAELGAASIMVQRASAAAGRAAVVVLADDPLFYENEPVGAYGGLRARDIELSAGMILSAHPRFDADFTVDVSDVPEEAGPIAVSVRANYACGTVSMFCGIDAAIALDATTTHTYQPARYDYAAPDLGGQTAALSEANTGEGSRMRKRGFTQRMKDWLSWMKPRKPDNAGRCSRNPFKRACLNPDEAARIAREIADKTWDDPRFPKLTGMMCWDAVRQCQSYAGGKPPRTGDGSTPASEQPISLDDHRVEGPSDMNGIPNGRFIGFYDRDGKLVHAMLSTGGGTAAGNKNGCIGMGKDVGWEVLDLGNSGNWNADGTFGPSHYVVRYR